MRRVTWTLLTAALAVSLLPPPGAAAAAGKGEVFLMNSTLPAMVPGQTGWAALTWRAGDDDLSEFSVTVVAPPGWEIAYPENRVADTSLWDNDSLTAGEVDFTAFRVEVAENAPSPSTQPLTAFVSYSYMKNGKKERASSKQFAVTVPVASPTNPAFSQPTSSLGPLPVDSQTWVDVSYRGVSTAFDFRLSVTDSAGAGVVYPNDGTYSSLSRDDVLDVGETDHASVRIDTTGLAPGLYTMQTSVTHRVATQPRSLPGAVSFEVVEAQQPEGASIAAASARSTRDGSSSASGSSFAEVEAARLCDVRRMTFFSTVEMRRRLRQRVVNAGHSVAEYRAWRGRLDERPVVRAHVFGHYRSMCGSVTNPADDPDGAS